MGLNFGTLGRRHFLNLWALDDLRGVPSAHRAAPCCQRSTRERDWVKKGGVTTSTSSAGQFWAKTERSVEPIQRDAL